MDSTPPHPTPPIGDWETERVLVDVDVHSEWSVVGNCNEQ